MKRVCKINNPRRHKTDTSEEGGSVKPRKRNPGTNKCSKGYSVGTGRRIIQGIKRNPKQNNNPGNKSGEHRREILTVGTKLNYSRLRREVSFTERFLAKKGLCLEKRRLLY